MNGLGAVRIHTTGDSTSESSTGFAGETDRVHGAPYECG